MRVSYDWLKTMIDIPEDPKTLSDEYIRTGTEVEAIDTVGESFDHVVTAKVLTKTPHPDSDHMYVCSVDVGDKNLDADGNPAPLQIVCGAQNFEAGDHIVTAMIGAVLPGDVKIKKSKLRGVVSMGMNCSARELGLGGDHSGIMILPEDTPCGMPFAEYVGSSDTVLDCEITPNRPDCLSMIGMARETGAIFDRDFHVELPAIKAETGRATDDELSVEIADEGLCDRYVARIVRNVKVGPSPDWMVKRLNALGVRPHNNIVDITNYVMMAYGQPLHCFDADMVQGHRIVVRTQPEGTPFVTLDGEEHLLGEHDLSICNAEEPMCIAGVFGGKGSGTYDTTTNVVLESAYFHPTWIRKSARRHGLSTDASYRFERGIDPNGTIYALKQAAILCCQLAGGKVSMQINDVYPAPIADAQVRLDYEYCDRLIGKAIGHDMIRQIAESLEMKVVAEDAEGLVLDVPAYRTDVQRPCDVVEDILRIYGYNNVEIPTQLKSSLTVQTEQDAEYRLQNLVGEQLVGCGFYEIMNNSLTKVSYYEQAGLNAYPWEQTVKLVNPLSADLGVMRQTLLFGGLESIVRNANRKNANLRFFEVGNCYHYHQDRWSYEDPSKAYVEEAHLGLWVTGKRVCGSWAHADEDSSFCELNAYVQNIFARVGLTKNMMVVETSDNNIFASGLKVMTRGGKTVAELGILSHKLQRAADIANPVYYADIHWNTLMKAVRKNKLEYQEISKYPAVSRDLALLIDNSVKFAQIEEIAFQTEKKLLKRVELFDVYQGKNLPEGKKSYAVNFIIQDATRTLNDKAIDAIMTKLINNIKNKLGAELR